MYEIWEKNKNQMVNQKQFQLESTKQNKKAYHVDLSKNFKQNLKESNECSPIWNRRKQWQRAREKE